MPRQLPRHLLLISHHCLTDKTTRFPLADQSSNASGWHTGLSSPVLAHRSISGKMSSSSANSVPTRLEGQVALITGGASGIGASTARLFVEHGASVLIADIQDDLGLSLSQDLSISYIHCDATSDSDVQTAVALAFSKYGKLDIMFNNARINGKTNLSISDSDNDDFINVFRVNAYGGFLGAKHASRIMIPATCFELDPVGFWLRGVTRQASLT